MQDPIDEIAECHGVRGCGHTGRFFGGTLGQYWFDTARLFPHSCSSKHTFVSQTYIEKTMLAIVKGSNITSFEFNVLYDFEQDKYYLDIYNYLFTATTEGTCLLPSIVPDRSTFSRFAGRVAKARDPGRPGCNVKLKINGDVKYSVDGSTENLELLVASYDAPKNDFSARSPSTDLQLSNGSGHAATPRPLDRGRISFHLDRSNHHHINFTLNESDGVCHKRRRDPLIQWIRAQIRWI
jgi:hypothetical protein